MMRYTGVSHKRIMLCDIGVSRLSKISHGLIIATTGLTCNT